MVLYTFHVVRTNLTRLSVLIKGDVLISGVVVTDSRGSTLHLGSSTVFFLKELSSFQGCTYRAEISLESSENVGVGAILGGVNNHIKAFMLYPLKDQRCLLTEGP